MKSTISKNVGYNIQRYKAHNRSGKNLPKIMVPIAGNRRYSGLANPLSNSLPKEIFGNEIIQKVNKNPNPLHIFYRNTIRKNSEKKINKPTVDSGIQEEINDSKQTYFHLISFKYYIQS